MTPRGWPELHAGLADLERRGLRRTLHGWTPDSTPGHLRRDGQRLLDLASNDYLGLGRQVWTPDGAAALLAEHGFSGPERDTVLHAMTRFGAGASRLISGNDPVFGLLERELARLKGRESALVFGSGMAANLGVIPALVGRGDAVFSDELNHASIIDGIRLSRAEVQIYPHRDLTALERQLRGSPAPRKLIVTDALFSMDGTLAPLPELCALARRYGARLMVDEAHSGGVFGAEGAGLAHAQGVAGQVDVLMGTLGKAYGSAGAYIAGDRVLTEWLLNRARTFIFTTALPPASAAHSLLNVLHARSLDRERAQLHRCAAAFRRGVQALGWDTAGSESQVVPAVVGGEAATLALAGDLRRQGFGAVAIRPPTVPPGQARVRFALSAAHPWAELQRCLEALPRASTGANVIGEIEKGS